MSILTNRARDFKPDRKNAEFDWMARSCLAAGAYELSAREIIFLGGALQQMQFCALTTEQSNRLLDFVIRIQEGEQ
jgi:hypothetical protein